jgi:Fe-S oxidoreductase
MSLFILSLIFLKKTEKPIVILADVFTGLLDQNVLFTTIKVLKKLGYTPYILNPQISGKALLVAGFIDKFKLIAKKWHTVLNPIFAQNVPVIGLENSITLIFRDEFSKFYQKLDGVVETLAEFLAKNTFSHLKVANNNTTYTLLPHCTEQALQAIDAKHWESIFKQLGLNLNTLAIGCCGMAGTYGHEQEHLLNSKKLFAMHWEPILENKSSQYLATGYSCRSQTLRLTNTKIPHPIEIISAKIVTA